MVEQWLLPRYDALAAATTAQLDAWEAFCKAPSSRWHSPAQATLRHGFGRLGGGGVHHLRPGDPRLARRPLQSVPGAAQCGGALARRADRRSQRGAPGAGALQPAQRRGAGPAGAGAPAAMRTARPRALASGPESARRCAIGLAIAGNLDEIARGIRSGWGDRSTGLLAQLIAGKSDPVFFPDPNALLSQMVTDLAGAYQRVVDQRLLVVAGKTIADAKPALADRRRSGRSKATILATIASADALSEALAKGLDAKAQGVVDKAGQAALDAVKRLPDDVGAAAADAKGRRVLEATVVALKAAQKTVAEPLASGLGVPLGFNALDGD